MRSFSKIGVVALGLGALVANGSVAWAAPFSTTNPGQVQDLVGQDSSYNLAWASVAGFTSAGGCLRTSGQTPLVILRIKADAQGNQMWSLLTAAKLAGRTVKATVDDTVHDAAGYCYLRAVSLQD